MPETRTAQVSLFVDRFSQRWVVRDSRGQFWILPPSDNPWENRRPFQLSADSNLEPIPAHYKYLLKLPLLI